MTSAIDFKMFLRAQVNQVAKEQIQVDSALICWQMNFMWNRSIQLTFLVLLAVVILMILDLETVWLAVQADDWVVNLFSMVPVSRVAFSS